MKESQKTLKKAYPNAPFVALINTSIPKAKKAPQSIAIGSPVPNIKLPDIYGEKTALKKLKGNCYIDQ